MTAFMAKQHLKAHCADGSDFVEPPTPTPPSKSDDGYGCVLVGDFDGDGTLDAAVMVMQQRAPKAMGLVIRTSKGVTLFGAGTSRKWTQIDDDTKRTEHAVAVPRDLVHLFGHDRETANAIWLFNDKLTRGWHPPHLHRDAIQVGGESAFAIYAEADTWYFAALGF